MHGLLGGERDRHLIYSGVGEVAESSRAVVALWQHHWRAELDPTYIFDGGQGQEHGVPLLTHFVRLVPQELTVGRSGRVGASVRHRVETKRFNVV